MITNRKPKDWCDGWQWSGNWRVVFDGKIAQTNTPAFDTIFYDL
jgi:hypothetical protein